MDTRITDVDLAERLSEVLDRIETGGERFAIVQDGEIIAIMAPIEPRTDVAAGEDIGGDGENAGFGP